MGVASLFFDFKCEMEGGRAESLDLSEARNDPGAAAMAAATLLALRNRRLEIIIPPRSNNPSIIGLI
jgi:hypothetical protein